MEEEPFIATFVTDVVNAADKAVTALKTGSDTVIEDLKVEPSNKIKLLEHVIHGVKNAGEPLIHEVTQALFKIPQNGIHNMNYGFKLVHEGISSFVQGILGTVNQGFNAAAQGINETAGGINQSVSEVVSGVQNLPTPPPPPAPPAPH